MNNRKTTEIDIVSVNKQLLYRRRNFEKRKKCENKKRFSRL